MRLKSFGTLFCLFFASAISAVAQNSNYNFSKVDIDNGLSHNQVFSIYRDSSGFVWFGTGSGLNRFDGNNCKVFINNPEDPTSLKENYVIDIFPLPGGELWIGSRTDASIYDPLTEKFSPDFRSYLKKLNLPQSRIIYSVKDQSGNYWFLFEKEGLYKYSPASQKSSHFSAADSELKGSVITYFSEDMQGNLWVIFSNGYLMLIDSKTLKPLKEVSYLKKLFKSQYTLRLFTDKQNGLWVYVHADPKGVYYFNPSTSALSHFSTKDATHRLNDDMIMGIIQDKAGAIWIGTDHGGINVVNESNHSDIVYLTNKESDKNTLGYNSVEKLYHDEKGLIWVGTGKKGVSYLNQNIVQFGLYRHEAGNKNSVPDNDINYFAEDRKGNIWIGTNGAGLIYFDLVNNRFTRYLNDPSNSNSLSNNIIVSLCVDHEDKLWIGTYHGGMDVFDGKTFTHYRHDSSDPSSIGDNRIWHILEDRNHEMWIGTLAAGLHRFDRKTKKFTRYYFENDIPKPLHSNYIPVIREDRQGNLWVGTSDGVEVFNNDRTRITYYKHTESPTSLSHQNVQDITIDKRDLVWVGTRNGLDVWNNKTKNFKRFGISDGLPDNNISNIAEDKKGNLWITTTKGISQLIIDDNKENISFRVRKFTESNNVQGKVFNESSAMVSSRGLIFFGGSTGFNIIDPEKIPVSKSTPSLAFTNIDIFDNDINAGESVNRDVILRKAVPFANELTLSYNENIFSIEFSALDFSGNNQYAYKLDGFNKNWMFTNNSNRKVTYTNLDPGTYFFKLKATNSDGVWGPEKTLKIIINPPFWKTPVAFFIYLLCIAGILYLARRYTLEKARMRFEVRQQRKERERIQAMDAVKTKFFTNVSHEFRTPLSLVLTPLDRIIRFTSDPDHKKQLQLVQRNAKRLLNLVNQLLDFRKMEVQEFKFQPTEGDIIKFTREISYSFSDVSEMKDIRLSFTANLDSFITYFDKDKLEKILFKLLSNAFKYTPSKGSVEVQIEYLHENPEEELINIIVKDSGIGISADKHDSIFERFFQNDVTANISNPGTGIGLSITKEFVRLHNGKIIVNSEQNKGTSFTVSLPVRNVANYNTSDQRIRPELITSLRDEHPGSARMAKAQIKKIKPLILLVEDNDDFRFYLKDNLIQEFNVVEAGNGQEALDKLIELKPDLIVSDVMMPYMDGIELSRRLKLSASLSGIPIILLTAIIDEDLQSECYKLGVNEYMTKPFTYEVLAARIKNLLAHNKPARKKAHGMMEVDPSPIEIIPADERFLKQVLQVIEKNISNPDFTVEELSKELFMHRAGMYRKLLSLTGLPPLEFIRSIRLKRARQLLEKSQMTISEIAYEVGFNNPKKFSQHFKEEFGTTPTNFIKQHSKNQ